MDRDEFLQKVTEIGTCEDDATRRGLLAELQEGVSTVFDSNADLTEKNTKLNEDVTKLQKDNLDLFLRIGTPKDPAQALQDATGSKTEPEKKRSFKDLFNDKGGLK